VELQRIVGQNTATKHVSKSSNTKNEFANGWREKLTGSEEKLPQRNGLNDMSLRPVGITAKIAEIPNGKDSPFFLNWSMLMAILGITKLRI
jgi:hypothetical protein